MSFRLLLATALGLVVTMNTTQADGPEKAKQKTQPQELQGTWKLKAFEVMGQKVPQLPFAELVITADAYIMKSNRAEDEPSAMRYTLDPKAKPKAINLLPPKGDDSKAVWKGIYTMDGDELKICLPLIKTGDSPSDNRPDTFITKDKDLMLITAVRVKR
jgi:uncharacterized protein (TIGR03067 family)